MIVCILLLFDVKFIRLLKKFIIIVDIYYILCINFKRGGINLFVGGGGEGGLRDKLIFWSKGGEG